MTEKEIEKETTVASATKTGANVKVYSNRWLAKVVEEKPAFPDELFDSTFSHERITSIVKALKEATDKEVNDSNRLLIDNYTYSLQVTSFKAPLTHIHLSRVDLEHSLLSEESEICLIVKDLKRGARGRPDYEPTIQHYEKLLRTNKIKQSVTVIPVSQLYNDFSTFELRRKLTFVYDKFLVESTIASQVNGYLGQKLLNKGRLAFPVDLQTGNFTEAIDKAMRTVCYKHHLRGLIQSIPIGKHSMTPEDIADNLIDVVGQFQDFHPGGYANVHKLVLRPQLNIPIIVPIYTAQGEKKEPKEGAAKEGEEAAATTETAEPETFDDAAAAKLIQRRAFPYGNIVPEDHLLDDEEHHHNNNEDRTPARRTAEGTRVVTTEGGVRRVVRTVARPGQTGTRPPVTRTNAPRPANGRVPAVRTAVGATNGRTRSVATPRKVVGVQNVKSSGSGVNVRAPRNLNGVSPASKGAIVKGKRTNLNRNAVLNILRNSGNGDLGNFLGRGNDSRGNSSNNNSNFHDNSPRGNRNSDNFDIGFTRRNNLSSSTEEFARNLALGLELRNFGSNNGNSFGGGRNFNNSNRF